jgi:hypothetical protein
MHTTRESAGTALLCTTAVRRPVRCVPHKLAACTATKTVRTTCIISHPIVVMLQGPDQLPPICCVAAAACCTLDLQLPRAPPEHAARRHSNLHAGRQHANKHACHTVHGQLHLVSFSAGTWQLTVWLHAVCPN